MSGFFTLVVHYHVLCAVMDILKMGSLNDVPDFEICHTDFKNKVASQVDRINKDHVFEYTCEVVSLGLLFLSFRDAIQDGDGKRIVLC